MPDIDTLPEILSPHYYQGRQGKRIRLAVMHTPEAPETPTTAEGVARYFQGARRASTHLVGDNNSVVRCVHDANTAFGAERANNDGLHYELAGYANQTPEQWADDYSNAALILAADCFRQWCDRFNLPKRRLSVQEIQSGAWGICGHADVYRALGGSAVRTDPGAHFPWPKFIALVNGSQRKQVSDMDVLAANVDGKVRCWLTIGGWTLREFPATPVNQFGFPQAAYDYAAKRDMRIELVTLAEINAINHRTQAAANIPV